MDALEAMEEENLPLVEKQDLNKLKDKQSSREVASKWAKKILSGVYTKRGKLEQVDIENLSSPDLDVYGVLKRTLEEKKLTVFYSYTTNTKSGEYSASNFILITLHKTIRVILQARSTVRPNCQRSLPRWRAAAPVRQSMKPE